MTKQGTEMRRIQRTGTSAVANIAPAATMRLRTWSSMRQGKEYPAEKSVMKPTVTRHITMARSMRSRRRMREMSHPPAMRSMRSSSPIIFLLPRFSPGAGASRR